MTILVIENSRETADALAITLTKVFPQDTIAAFSSALSALQYAYEHSEEIAIVFTAIVMRHVDGIEIAMALRKCSPGVKLFFIVQSENSELAEIVKRHGNGTCLSRPITVEAIRQATRFLQEPCPWEDELCEEGCLWKWCIHRKQKT